MAIIVFDLDGTLVETAPDLLATTNAVLAREGLGPVSRGDLNHLVGHGGRAMLGRALEMRGRNADSDTLDRLVPVFLDIYSDTIPGDSRPFDGALDAMERLASAGHVLAVCTNKYEGLSRRLLEALGMAEAFATIAGPDTFEARKPDPAHLLRTIGAAGGDPRAAVMIGDSFNDIEAARRAGVPSIGVPFGYTDTPIASLSPTKVIDHFDELDDALVAELTR